VTPYGAAAVSLISEARASERDDFRARAPVGRQPAPHLLSVPRYKQRAIERRPAQEEEEEDERELWIPTSRAIKIAR